MGKSDQAAASIIEAAAGVLAEHGALDSMASVATRAGVSRTTVYNYFPTRQDLLKALTVASLDDAADRIRAADLGSVPVPEALGRLSRALVTSGTKFAIVVTRPLRAEPTLTGQAIVAPVEELLRRGLEDGTFDRGVSPAMLATMYWGLIHGALQMTNAGTSGVETAAAAVTRIFLNGAQAAR